MDEDGLASPRKNDIRGARETFPVQAIPIPHPVEQATDDPFGRRIRALDAGHQAAALGGGGRIGR